MPMRLSARAMIFCPNRSILICCSTKFRRLIIYALTWEFAVREIPESPAGVNGETAQIPPATTLDVLRRHLERGDFRKIEHLLRDLECTDPGYTRFCQNIQPYMEHYDSQGILRYLQTIREVSS